METLPDLVWAKIGGYLDPYQLTKCRCVSKRICEKIDANSKKSKKINWESICIGKLQNLNFVSLKKSPLSVLPDIKHYFYAMQWGANVFGLGRLGDDWNKDYLQNKPSEK